MAEPQWLVLLHSLPAKPVAARMKIWRRLQKAGALRFTGSAYLLPWDEEKEELLLWLAQEIKTLGGEADFLRVGRTALLDSAGLARLFTQARDQAYAALEPEIEALERALSAPPPGPGETGKLPALWRRVSEEHRELSGLDFFPSGRGVELGRRLALLEEAIKARRTGQTGKPADAAPPKVVRSRVGDYRGRLWVTRARPFVDRMASAWLIRRFIDPGAVFSFVGEGEPRPAGAVGFDLAGGEFTHQGDWCTFEVLVKSFGLKDKALPGMARLVHQLDLDDGKYATPQARGVEEILRGVRAGAPSDQEALEQGMTVFAMLHASLSRR